MIYIFNMLSIVSLFLTVQKYNFSITNLFQNMHTTIIFEFTDYSVVYFITLSTVSVLS